ncbi:lactadherin-like [Patiria miniata]|uniref:F5/8 type C domain-containing protein n=1 Tax=Patiria miniata TaxID=46514 RepID=A0A914A9T1_PATMI|nr:lactadherin-like [Patiria miniata]
MEDGRIPDASITASSVWSNHADYGPTRARLNLRATNGAAVWCNAGASEANPWIQVDLGSNATITGVITQGRADYHDWVTEFKVAYSDDGQEWTTVTDDGSCRPTPMKFPGNSDQNTHVTTTFPRSFQARFLRILPTKYHRFCCMRFEVLGCTLNE